MEKKLKINIDRARISPEDIAAKRNFESVLAQVKTNPSKPFYRSKGFLFSVLAAVLLSAALFWNASRSHEHAYSENNNPATELKEKTETAVPATSEIGDIAESVTEGYTAQPAEKRLTAFAGIKPGIPFTRYTLNASQASSFTHKKGSIVEIPAFAFRTIKGKKTVSRNVEIRYREFRDAYDILIAGITMTYDSAGSMHQLRSAGMMEIRGYQNGEELEIIPGKQIQVRLATTIADPDYNVYKLNETINRWAYVGRDSVTGGMASREPDFGFATENEMLQTTVKPVEPKRKNQQHKNFKLSLSPYMIERHPELLGFNTMYFEVDERKGLFKSSFYSTDWADVSVLPSIDSTQLTFIFRGKTDSEQKTGKGNSVEVAAYPVYDSADSALVMQRYRDQLNTYRQGIKQKEEDQKRYKLLQTPQKMNMDGMIYRAFSISGFGVWNCDQIYKLPVRKSIRVRVSDERDSVLYFSSLQIINKKIRSTYYYDVSHGGFSTITIDPTSQNVIFAVIAGGDIAYVSSASFAALNLNQQQVPVKMKIRKNDFKDAEALRSFLMGL